MRNLLVAVRLFVVMSILTGFLYPLAMTGIARVFFPHKAQGSLIRLNGNVRGSSLIGQKFVDQRYFWGRPSAVDYQPMPSGATNFGPTSATLRDIVQHRRAHFTSTNLLPVRAELPAEMLFCSASGVDPHISPQAARLQIDRIARARGFTPEQRSALVHLMERFVESSQYGVFGESRINVFLLNLALDQLH